jgi:hypothetical protein
MQWQDMVMNEDPPRSVTELLEQLDTECLRDIYTQGIWLQRHDYS